MERIVLSEEELILLLNGELSKHEECNDCRFVGIVKLRDKDEGGCNWSNANLRCSGVPTEICKPVAERVICEAKAKYNIKLFRE